MLLKEHIKLMIACTVVSVILIAEAQAVIIVARSDSERNGGRNVRDHRLTVV